MAYTKTVWVNGTTAIEHALLTNIENGIVAVHADLSKLFQTGTIVAFGGSTTPTGWLLCDGSLVSTTTFAALFAVTGHAYNGGADPGGGNFKLPDFRDRQIIGVSATKVRGSTGGTRPHAHSISSDGAHTHSGTSGAASASSNIQSFPNTDFSSGTHTHSITVPASGGHSHTLAGTVDTAYSGVRFLVKT